MSVLDICHISLARQNTCPTLNKSNITLLEADIPSQRWTFGIVWVLVIVRVVVVVFYDGSEFGYGYGGHGYGL